MEQIARKLYEQWCRNGGRDGWAPDWQAFETGASLNGGHGLVADHFRETAAEIMPLDDPEAVARRLCLANASYECLGVRSDCTEATCTGWRHWIDDARELVAMSAIQ